VRGGAEGSAVVEYGEDGDVVRYKLRGRRM
jgi:hypothetical protein